MDFKENTLEHFIFYSAYSKAVIKSIAANIQGLVEKGMLDEAEMALVDALLIGMAKTDGEFEQTLEQCMQRTDKGDHILLALNAVLKAEKKE